MPDPVGVSTHLIPKQAVISVASATDNEIVAAVANKRICVVDWNCMAAGTTTITWKSGATAISGGYPLVANVGISVNHSVPDFSLKTSMGQALNLALSAAEQVSGYLTYYEL